MTNVTPSITATLTGKGLSMIIDNVPHVINQDHLNYAQILQALRTKDYTIIPGLIDIPKSIETFAENLVKIVDGVVTYNGREIHNTLTNRMLSMLKEGLDIKPMARFLINLMGNPSKRAVDELYNFMEACDLPITEDGELLVYRSVKADYWDQHTGRTAFSQPFSSSDVVNNLETFENGCRSVIVGGFRVVSVERNMVDDNPDRTCSHGLHVCSQKYGMYGSKLLLCSVNPADVVSVPKEYNSAKMRVCRYRVIKDCTEGFKEWNTSLYQDDSINGLDWNPNDFDDDYDLEDAPETPQGGYWNF